jgi:RNA polymerase sigma factor (sigma-70 family)
MIIDKDIDFELVKRAINNDQSAFKELHEKYQYRVSLLVRKIVFDPQEADDLTQEAFIKAFQSLKSFNFEFSFTTWLYKIASNNCIDYLRKKRLKTYSMDTPVEHKEGQTQQDYSDDTPTIETKIIKSEISSQIKDAIDSLPEMYRVVILMRHSEEKSYEEIAQILDQPLGTVKARIFRARELLNKSLRKIY